MLFARMDWLSAGVSAQRIADGQFNDLSMPQNNEDSQLPGSSLTMFARSLTCVGTEQDKATLDEADIGDDELALYIRSESEVEELKKLEELAKRTRAEVIQFAICRDLSCQRFFGFATPTGLWL